MVAKSKWIANYLNAAKRAWSGEPTEAAAATRFGILRRLLDLRVGDRLVIPHMPGDDFFTLATVSSPYHFDHNSGYTSYPWNKDDVDFGHVIEVDQLKLINLPINTDAD